MPPERKKIEAKLIFSINLRIEIDCKLCGYKINMKTKILDSDHILHTPIKLRVLLIATCYHLRTPYSDNCISFMSDIVRGVLHSLNCIEIVQPMAFAIENLKGKKVSMLFGKLKRKRKIITLKNYYKLPNKNLKYKKTKLRNERREKIEVN